MKDACSTAGRGQQKSKEKVDLNTHTFIVNTLRPLLSFMMNDIEDGLAKIHCVLQCHANGLESILVLFDAMAKQSTQAFVKLEAAVELLLSSAGSRLKLREVLARVSLTR